MIKVEESNENIASRGSARIKIASPSLLIRAKGLGFGIDTLRMAEMYVEDLKGENERLLHVICVDELALENSNLSNRMLLRLPERDQYIRVEKDPCAARSALSSRMDDISNWLGDEIEVVILFGIMQQKNCGMYAEAARYLAFEKNKHVCAVIGLHQDFDFTKDIEPSNNSKSHENHSDEPKCHKNHENTIRAVKLSLWEMKHYCHGLFILDGYRLGNSTNTEQDKIPLGKKGPMFEQMIMERVDCLLELANQPHKTEITFGTLLAVLQDKGLAYFSVSRKSGVNKVINIIREVTEDALCFKSRLSGAEQVLVVFSSKDGIYVSEYQQIMDAIYSKASYNSAGIPIDVAYLQKELSPGELEVAVIATGRYTDCERYPMENMIGFKRVEIVDIFKKNKEDDSNLIKQDDRYQAMASKRQ